METKITAKPGSKPRRSANQVTIIIAIIALVAMLVASFALLQNIQTKRLYASALRQVQTKLNQIQTALALQQAAVNKTQQSLSQQIQQADYQTEDWILAENLYLLKLAHYNLIFFDNVTLARKLVETVNKNLVKLDDPNLLNVRQKLIQALTKLKAAEQLDLSGILLQLNAIQKEINELPLLPSRVAQHAQKQILTPLSWKQYLWNNLKQIIVVRRLESPPNALLSPAHQTYLRDNIQYQLTQAQWAALHHQQRLYQSSLLQAISWIQQYFFQSDGATRSVIAILQQLAKINVAPKIPNIAKAIHAVQLSLNRRQQQRVAPTEYQNKPATPPRKLEKNALSLEPKVIAS